MNIVEQQVGRLSINKSINYPMEALQGAREIRQHDNSFAVLKYVTLRWFLNVNCRIINSTYRSVEEIANWEEEDEFE